jgi:hypothetical protein
MLKDNIKKYKDLAIECIDKLKGADQRIALAKAAKAEEKGGQSRIAEELQVGRDTIRKGHHEWKTGFHCEDAFHARGRKKAEDHLPHLLQDIQDIVDGQSQTDPSFKTTKKYTRLTVKEIRKRLIKEKKYRNEELPTNQTLNTKVNELGFQLKKVKKVKPLKKMEETDAIFDNLHEVHKENESKSNVMRISIDTKDRVKIGPFSRGGKSRGNVQAADHDFSNDHLTPFGILDVTNDHLELIFTETKATADFMVDCIEDYWDKQSFQDHVDTLIINADNGPENSSRRTQYMKRIIEFAAKYHVKVILAYYPPYHSKYNPVERAWGILEQHWNGDILDRQEAVLGFAESMTWKGENPGVTLTEKVYETGKKVEKKLMEIYEGMIDRVKGIEKWFIIINPEKCKGALQMNINNWK